MNDDEILAQCTKREEKVLNVLSEKYGKLCGVLAKNILHCREDEEECVSDGYLTFWETVPPHIPNSVKGYLLKLLRNICINRYYKNTAQKRNSSFDIAMEELGELVSHEISPEEVVVVKDLTLHINLFLEDLDRETRGIFVHRYWYGDSIEEISRKFGLKYNTTAVKLKRTKEKLKLYLQEQELIT
ncbi:MAG: sigma-70 family RNA polymerase sigma factor [Eubacteriales bacterium]